MNKCIIISQYDIDNFNIKHNIVEIIIYCFMVFSFIMTYFGYKLIKPALFSSGAIVGGGMGYVGSLMVMEQLDSVNCKILYLMTLFTSTFMGIFCLWAYNVANFLIGLGCGGSVGYFLYLIALHNIYIGLLFGYDLMLILSLLTPGIIFGIIALIKKENVSMLITSLSFPMLFIKCLDYGIHNNNSQIVNYNSNNEWLYIYSAIYLFMCSTGLITQLFFSKKEKERKEINYLPMTK